MATMTLESAATSSQSSDVLNARREARRRKILENAENRLKKLTGVEQKSQVTIDDFRPINYDSQDLVNTGHNIHYHDNPPRFVAPSSQVFGLNTSFPTDLAQNTPSQQSVEIRQRRIPIIISISCLANLLLALSTFIYDDAENNVLNFIFTPFLAYELVEYFITKTEVPRSNIMLMVLMGYIKNERLKRALVYFEYLSRFIQDLCVYFFVFVIVNQLLQVLFVFR